jgi:beta-glucanase (GH16 family)
LIRIFVVGLLVSVIQTPPPAQPAVIFFDDFNGPTIDWSKWNAVITGLTFPEVNDEQQAYVHSTDTLTLIKGDAEGADHGALAIHARYRPGTRTPDKKTFDFVSGRLDTRSKFDFTYGTAAARIKLTAGSGLWPAFWALGNGEWPATGEMDILENVGDAAWTNFALHGPGYSGAGGLAHRHYFKGSDITAWHVYALEWTANALVFSVDGQESWRVARAEVEKRGRWAYDNPKHVIVNLAVGGVYPHAVNRVSKPYNGLPQSTLDLITRGEATMLVDWVKVTKP